MRTSALLSLHIQCSERADGGLGELSQDKVRKSEACSTHAYDGLMLFCTN